VEVACMGPQLDIKLVMHKVHLVKQPAHNLVKDVCLVRLAAGDCSLGSLVEVEQLVPE
jgi:hypothetical protein